MKRLTRDKHSSLLRIFVNYGCDKFYNVGPWSIHLWQKQPKLMPKQLLDLSLSAPPYSSIGLLPVSLAFHRGELCVAGQSDKLTKRCSTTQGNNDNSSWVMTKWIKVILQHNVGVIVLVRLVYQVMASTLKTFTAKATVLPPTLWPFLSRWQGHIKCRGNLPQGLHFLV